METNKETLLELLNTSQSWGQLSHMLADYLLNPYIALLFGSDAKYPSLVGHQRYKEVNEKAKRNEKAAIDYRKRMNHEWRQVFPMLLVEFFRLRLLDTTSCEMRTKYHYLFLDLVGDGKTKRNFEEIIIGFLDMLRDYLNRNCPCLTKEERSLPLAELMQAIHRYYTGESHPDGPDAKWTKWNSHILFEKLPYSSELMRLFNEIAKQRETHPMCHYFFITSEFLSGLFIYVYIVEFLIFIGNRNLPIGEQWKPNLIANLQKYQFKEYCYDK